MTPRLNFRQVAGGQVGERWKRGKAGGRETGGGGLGSDPSLEWWCSGLKEQQVLWMGVDRG